MTTPRHSRAGVSPRRAGSPTALPPTRGAPQVGPPETNPSAGPGQLGEHLRIGTRTLGQQPAGTTTHASSNETSTSYDYGQARDGRRDEHMDSRARRHDESDPNSSSDKRRAANRADKEATDEREVTSSSTRTRREERQTITAQAPEGAAFERALYFFIGIGTFVQRLRSTIGADSRHADAGATGSGGAPC